MEVLRVYVGLSKDEEEEEGVTIEREWEYPYGNPLDGPVLLDEIPASITTGQRATVSALVAWWVPVLLIGLRAVWGILAQ